MNLVINIGRTVFEVVMMLIVIFGIAVGISMALSICRKVKV